MADPMAEEQVRAIRRKHQGVAHYDKHGQYVMTIPRVEAAIREALEQSVQRVADPPEGDWTPSTAIEQIEKCGFECEGGPLANNSAWRWIRNTLLALQEWTDEKTDVFPNIVPDREHEFDEASKQR